MPQISPKTNSSSTMVYTELRGLIERGAVLHGGRLPTEAELCRRHGLGRAAVRRAIEQLRREGLVVTQQGSGAYVAGRPESEHDAPRRVETLQDLERLFEYRVLLERESAALAAERRTHADLLAIQNRVKRLEIAIASGAMGEREDFDLHAEIARASGNPFLLTGVLALRTDVLFGMKRAQMPEVMSSIQRLALVTAEHADIVDAIRVGSPAKARQAMEDHIRLSYRRLLAGVA